MQNFCREMNLKLSDVLAKQRTTAPSGPSAGPTNQPSALSAAAISQYADDVDEIKGKLTDQINAV